MEKTTDPRVNEPGICGISRIVGRTEFMCIAKPHDTEHQRSRQRDPRGYVPKAERHHFVNRYPGRAA